MKIAIIGPGIMDIPPKSWGAVEMIIWNHKKYLEELGHKVDIYNTVKLDEVARDINSKDYDFIHLQYDVYADYFVKNLKKPFCITSHYGWLPLKNKWSKEYKEIFKSVNKAPGIIALSDKIEKIHRKEGYKGFIRVLRNGVEADKFSFKEYGNEKAICLGNIQPRKRQALLAKVLGGLVRLDFIGPNFKGGKKTHDEEINFLLKGKIDFASFDLEPDFQPNDTCKYLGVWSREEIYNNLSNYSCLVLTSESEADPLVVKEALIAGLSVVVSEESAANLDDRKFIYILKNKDYTKDRLADIINSEILLNTEMRPSIVKYAYDKFDYKVVVNDYVEIIKEFQASVA